jgi:large subunit ribosomal protein L12
MEYVYAAMLLHSAGQKIDEEGVKKVLTASGVKVEDAKVKALVASLEGVNISEAIKSAAPIAAAPAAAPPASAPAGGAAPAKEAKKEEDTKKSEEEAASGLASLFG